MDEKIIENSSAGRYIKTRQGYFAFLPDPLPPKLEYTRPIACLLADAANALGELAGTGNSLPTSSLLVTPAIRREAISSSRIEGTQVSLSDLFFFEASESQPTSNLEIQEIQKYIQALEFGLENLKKERLSTNFLRQIHKILVQGDGEKSIPGEFRTTQNWIGPAGCSLFDATYVPPPPEEIPKSLEDLDRYLHSKKMEPDLIQSALIHYQFEAIHPFADGNGRIGRLLITFFLSERGILKKPFLSLSEFFDQYREEYYACLLGISRNGEWNRWIEFFLRAIIHQSQVAISYIKKLEKLHEEYQKRLASTKKIPGCAPRILEEAFINPVISIPALSRKWKIPFNSVKKGLQRLVEIGILEETTGKKRDRLFVAPQLMKLLTSPPINAQKPELGGIG